MHTGPHSPPYNSGLPPQPHRHITHPITTAQHTPPPPQITEAHASLVAFVQYFCKAIDTDTHRDTHAGCRPLVSLVSVVATLMRLYLQIVMRALFPKGRRATHLYIFPSSAPRFLRLRVAFRRSAVYFFNKQLCCNQKCIRVVLQL